MTVTEELKKNKQFSKSSSYCTELVMYVCSEGLLHSTSVSVVSTGEES